MAAALPFLLRLGVTSESWRRDSAETAQMLKALDRLPQGARVASAVLVRRENWAFNHFEHIGGYAVVRRDALVNSNFALPRVHMLSLRQGGPGFDDPSQRLLQTARDPVDLAAFAPARQADYLWYVGDRRPDTLPPGATTVFATRRSMLLRLAMPSPPR